MQRVDGKRLPGQVDRLVQTTQIAQQTGQSVFCIRVRGCQFDRTSELDLRRGKVEVGVHHHPAERDVRVSEIRSQRERGPGVFARLCIGLHLRRTAEDLIGERSPGKRALRIDQRITLIQTNRLIVEVDRLVAVLGAAMLEVEVALQQRVVGGKITARRLVAEFADLAEQGRFQGACHRRGDVALHSKDILQLAIVGLRPQCAAVIGLDQRRDDAHLSAFFSHRAFEQSRHAEFPPDAGIVVLLLAAKLERGVTADHLQIVHLRERGNQRLGQAVREVVLLGVATLVGQRQHGNGFGGRSDRRNRNDRCTWCHVQRQFRYIQKLPPHQHGDGQ